MSYILDALKRSEQERHQGELNHATIDTIMIPPKPKRFAVWPYLLVIVLLLNAGVFLYFQYKSSDITQNVSQEVPSLKLPDSASLTQRNSDLLQNVQNINSSTVEARGSVEENLTKQKPLPAHLLNTPNLAKRYDVNSYSPDRVASEVAFSKPELTDEGMEIIRPKSKAVASSDNVVEVEKVVALTEEYSEKEEIITSNKVVKARPKMQFKEGSNTEDFTSFMHLNDLDLSFQKSIPDIRFNSHIYSLNPSDRRVMINDLYLREGQDFSGIEIKTIGEFYIVLEKGGQQFKLPVLRDWFSP